VTRGWRTSNTGSSQVDRKSPSFSFSNANQRGVRFRLKKNQSNTCSSFSLRRWFSEMVTHGLPSCGSGAAFGAVRRNFIRPAPVAFPARPLNKSVAVSTTPTFCATAAAIH
jgi:hypothetical protein